MKASEFKNLIKEAVKEAIREELQSNRPAPAPIQETVKTTTTGNSILDALNLTKSQMTREDARHIIGSTTPSLHSNTLQETFTTSNVNTPKVGLDLSQLNFVKNAAAIVKAADKKQSERNGL